MSECKGRNCNTTDGKNHSKECKEDYHKTIYGGAGNRHPEFRYKGYKNIPINDNATEDQYVAWEEGQAAREG